MQTVEFPIYLNMTEHGLNMTYFRVFGNPRLLSEKYWHKNRIVLKSTEPEKLHLIFSNITNITRSEEESGEVILGISSTNSHWYCQTKRKLN